MTGCQGGDVAPGRPGGPLAVSRLVLVVLRIVLVRGSAALDLPGVDESRGYIQSWWGQDNPIPERSAQRIFKAADQILKAGTSEGGR